MTNFISRKNLDFFRVIGKGILSNYYQVQNVPKRLNNAKSLNDSTIQNRYPNPSASSIMSDISLVSLCSETQANEVDENEEILAIDGTYVDEEKSYQMMEGVTLNEKFSQDPKKYFEEKLMTAIFRKVWHKVSEKLDIVANLHSGKFPTKKITEKIGIFFSRLGSSRTSQSCTILRTIFSHRRKFHLSWRRNFPFRWKTNSNIQNQISFIGLESSTSSLLAGSETGNSKCSTCPWLLQTSSKFTKCSVCHREQSTHVSQITK